MNSVGVEPWPVRTTVPAAALAVTGCIPDSMDPAPASGGLSSLTRQTCDRAMATAEKTASQW